MIGKNTTLKHFNRYPGLLTYLNNIHIGMKDHKYDFPLIISGGTGNGKSMLLLHIIELWYRVILKQRLKTEHIRHVQNTREGWIGNFNNIEMLDINANDEGTNSLMSKETMQKFNITLNKLYNVFRKNLYFTIILIPDYFELPLWFRKRVRGCIEVEKRGLFKFYTKRDLYYVNSYNEGKSLKTLKRARPSLTGTFPDYDGVLRKPYEDMNSLSAKEILKELIIDIKINKVNTVSINYDQAINLMEKGLNRNDICKELHISPQDYTKIRKRYQLLKKGSVQL